MFEGCPNAATALQLVRELAGELDIDADVRELRVESSEEAGRLRFLGSPTIRVEGKDVEPGADERREYVLACRVYRTTGGLVGVPDRACVREALVDAAGSSVVVC